MKHQKQNPKTARIAALSAIAVLVMAPLVSAVAGEPVALKKAPVEKLCAIPGFYKEYPMGDGTLIVTCHMISTRACLYLPGPCPQGTAQERYGNTVPAPAPLKVEEGRKFFAHYNEEGKLVVRMVNDYELSEHQNTDGTVTLILTTK